MARGLVVFGVYVGDVNGFHEVATVQRAAFHCALTPNVKSCHASGEGAKSDQSDLLRRAQ